MKVWLKCVVGHSVSNIMRFQKKIGYHYKTEDGVDMVD